MSTRLRLGNFKCHREVDLRLAPITAFFGANSSGKTSLLQALLLLKQTAASADRASVLNLGSEHDRFQAGSFRGLLGDVGLPLDIGLSWAPHGRTMPWDDQLSGLRGEVAASDWLAFSTRLSQPGSNGSRQGVAVVDHLRYGFGDVKSIHYDGSELPPLRAEGFDLVRQGGPHRWLPGPVKCYGFPDEVGAEYQDAGFVFDLQLALEQVLKRVLHLGPLRDHGRREYRWSGTVPEDVGAKGERFVELLLARQGADPPSAGTGEAFAELIASRLVQLGLVESFTVRPVAPSSDLYLVWVRTPGSAREVLLTDVGVGVSQVLPVLVLCYAAPRGSIILLEQPEIHLHPAVQSGLADILIDAAERRGVQIIVESHSEHLLRRLQRRIAENAQPAEGSVATPEGIALYFCQMRDGAAQVEELALDAYGDIANWPPGFFGDEFGEIAATVQAQMARRQAWRA